MKEILLVEDDSLYSKLLSYILENSGFIVDCATNGAEAIGMIDTKKYDLIITDLLMPQTDGLELLKHVKGNDSKAKVLVLSIMNNDYYQAQTALRSADGFLRKPVKAKDFVQAVKNLLHTTAA